MESNQSRYSIEHGVALPKAREDCNEQREKSES